MFRSPFSPSRRSPSGASRPRRLRALAVMLALAPALAGMGAGTARADGPDLIFKKSTVWKMLTPDHKLAVYGIDDPVVSGVSCHYTQPEKGGLGGMFGVAEEVSDISLSCHQTGPVSFTGKFEQGEVVFSERRSLIFKRMQIVRGCDEKRNTLIYLVYSDKLVEGSPKNATSAVPITPWGAAEAPRCADWLKR